MNPSALLKARAVINGISKAEMALMAQELMNLPWADEVEKQITERIRLAL